MLAEILAIAILRALYILRRDGSTLPRGAKVQHIRKRPVYRFPFLGRKEGERERLRRAGPRDREPAERRGASPEGEGE